MISPIQTSLTLGYLVGGIAFVAPILGFVAPKGLAPLVICGGIFGLLILLMQKRRINWLSRPVVAILIGLCVWALISTFWSIDTESAIKGTAKLAGNFAVGGFLFIVVQSLNEAEKKIALKWLLAGFIFVAGAVVLEIVLGGPLFLALKGIDPGRSEAGIYWLNNSIVVLALLVWPLCLARFNKDTGLHIKKRTVLLIFCGFALVLILTIQIAFSSGAVALLVGLFGAGAVWLLGRRAGIIGTVVLVIIGLGLPYGFRSLENPVTKLNTVISIPSSAEHRLRIWEFTAEKVVQKPIAGWGMNASKIMPGGKTILYSDAGNTYGHALPLHPHNAILQLWLELGLPGIILYLGLCVFIIMTAVNRNRSKFESAMITGQFMTALTIANLSFGVWQAWWIATLWLSASLILLAVKTRD